MEIKVFSSGSESKLDSGKKWIGERPLSSQFSRDQIRDRAR